MIIASLSYCQFCHYHPRSCLRAAISTLSKGSSRSVKKSISKRCWELMDGEPFNGHGNLWWCHDVNIWRNVDLQMLKIVNRKNVIFHYNKWGHKFYRGDRSETQNFDHKFWPMAIVSLRTTYLHHFTNELQTAWSNKGACKKIAHNNLHVKKKKWMKSNILHRLLITEVHTNKLLNITKI